MSLSGSSQSDFLLVTWMRGGLLFLLESLLTVGLACRSLLQLITYNWFVDEPGAGNDSWVVGIESALAVRDADLSISEEVLIRSPSLVFAALAVFVYGSRVGGAGLLLTVYACANWLVLVVDPFVPLVRRRDGRSE